MMGNDHVSELSETETESERATGKGKGKKGMSLGSGSSPEWERLEADDEPAFCVCGRPLHWNETFCPQCDEPGLQPEDEPITDDNNEEPESDNNNEEPESEGSAQIVRADTDDSSSTWEPASERRAFERRAARP